VSSAVTQLHFAEHVWVYFKLSILTATWVQSISKVWYSFLVLVRFIGPDLKLKNKKTLSLGLLRCS